jgi:hypothetical protein
MGRKVGIGLVALGLGAAAAWWYLGGSEQPADTIPHGAAATAGPREPIEAVAAPATTIVASVPAAQPAAPAASSTTSASGRVYDAATGEGLPGVMVWARTVAGSSPRPAVTDDTGRFRFEALQPELWFFDMRDSSRPDTPPTSHQLWRRIAAGDAVDDLEFALEGGLTISGVVVDTKEMPVSDARVTARGEVSLSATTDEAGRFSLQGCGGGQVVRVQAGKDGYLWAKPMELRLRDRPETDVRLVLAREATISGTVVSKYGGSTPNAMVLLRPRDVWVRRPVDRPESQRSHRDGGFTIGGLGPGTYQLQAQPYRQPSFFSSRIDFPQWDDRPLTTVRLREGEHRTGVRLVVEDDGRGDATVTGRVTDQEGRPLEGVRVDLENGRYMAEGATDASGSFTIDGLVPGEYQGRVAAAGYQRGMLTKVTAPSRGVAIVLERLGRIRGRVVDAATGAPIDAFGVATRYTRGGAARAPGGANLAHVAGLTFVQHHDRAGRFEVDPMDTNATDVVVWTRGYAARIQMIEVPPDQTVDLEFRLEPAATIAGVILDARGEPVAEAQVFVGEMPQMHDPREGAPHEAADISAPDGSFELVSVPLDVVQVAVYKPGLGPGTAPVALRAGETARVTVRLGARSTQGRPQRGSA